MKFFRYFLFSSLMMIGLLSCTKKTERPWEVDLKNSGEKATVTDISAEFYNPNVSLEQFTQKFPWFQGTVPDEDFADRRKDSGEIKVYKDAIARIDPGKLSTDLGDLFARIQYYFPSFKKPNVYIYSSALQGIMDPIFFEPREGILFIDITAFMGENNENYKGLEQYFQKSMNPKNILPKAAQIFAEHFVEPTGAAQKYLDHMVYYGKLMIVKDFFLPNEPPFLKMNYTPEQYEWAVANEANIWNYFVENDLLFSDDARLAERFINPGPFSKFYTEVDNDSSPQIGIFTGWQIGKKFFEEKPETPLTEFLKMNAQEIFNQSNYKPKD